jgi:hypothetical protein
VHICRRKIFGDVLSISPNGHVLPMAGNSMNFLPEPSTDKKTKSTEYEQKNIKEFSARTTAQ